MIEMELSETLLKEHYDQYESFLLNKTLLDFVKLIVDYVSDGLENNTRECIKTILNDLKIQEFTHLKEMGKTDTDNFLLGLHITKINELPKQNAGNLIKLLRNAFHSKLLKHLEKLKNICHGELVSHTHHQDFISQKIKLYDQLSENYSVLIERKQNRLKICERFFQLQQNVAKFDDSYALDLLMQTHIKEDQKILILNDVVKRRIFESTCTLNAYSIVVEDIEKELNSIENKLKLLNT